MIPDSVMETLFAELVHAVACARSGAWSAGYDTLLQGLHLAETALEAPAPWAAELVARYQQAIAAFEQRYGVELG